MAGHLSKKNILIVAAITGLITGLLIYRFLSNTAAKSQATLIPEAMAKVDIKPRMVIEPWMVTTVYIPRSRVPDGVGIRSENTYGKVALVFIARGKPINPKDIENRDSSLGLSYVIPNSMRAVTVAMDPVIGVAGFLRPGDHVDVVATFKDNQSITARTVIQNVQLLALGPQMEKGRIQKDGDKPAQISNKDTATLLVTPSQAERLVLAENQGKLRLVLRGVNDKSISYTSSAVMGTPRANVVVTKIRPNQPEPRPAVITKPAPPSINAKNSPVKAITRSCPVKSAVSQKPKPKRPTIEVIRGTTVEKIEVGNARAKSKEESGELPSDPTLQVGKNPDQMP